MQECQIAIIAPHPTSVVRMSSTWVNPSLRDEVSGGVSPEQRGAIDGPGRDVDSGAFRDVLGNNGGVADCDSHDEWDRWVESENLVADCGEVREGFKNGGNIDLGV